MTMEAMRDFFAARVREYDAHMLQNVEGMAAAYEKAAACLPADTENLLDLGCGTGLELDLQRRVRRRLFIRVHSRVAKGRGFEIFVVEKAAVRQMLQ